MVDRRSGQSNLRVKLYSKMKVDPKITIVTSTLIGMLKIDFFYKLIDIRVKVFLGQMSKLADKLSG